MPVSFLSRFQEACDAGESASIRYGTETFTKVANEQFDADRSGQKARFLAASTGTKTAQPTETETEDAVPGGVNLRAIPPSLATTTKSITNISKEVPDEDPVRRTFRAIPTEPFPAFTGTMTGTAIRREETDRDADSKGRIRVIPHAVDHHQ
jgi:hypothetical protein